MSSINTDLINQAINDPSISKNKKLASISFGVFFSCILFSVPLAIVYNFFYYKRPGWFSSVILFVCVTLLGFTATLMFYRIVAMNDMEVKINKMSANSVSFVAGVTFAAFTIVAITLFAIGVNPDLVRIFENTFGYWYIHLWGLTDLCSKIFTSSCMNDKLKNSNPKDFNYNFLITRINLKNIERFIAHANSTTPSANVAKISNNSTNNSTNNNTNNMNVNQVDSDDDDDDYDSDDEQRGGRRQAGGTPPSFPLDFDMKFTGSQNDKMEQKAKLENLVNIKQSFGHYLWVYLSSIVALFVSMIGVIMG